MKKQLVAFAVVTLLAAGLALASEWYMNHDHWYAKEPEKDFALARLIADIRASTSRYQDLAQAKADGYVQISGNVPLEGYHFRKAAITQVDHHHPSTLLYAEREGRWQLVGLKYIAPPGGRPTETPFTGIDWERSLAICRYADWQEYRSTTADGCPQIHPETNSAFAVWYPDSWAIRLWIWYPNPYGLFASMNPLLAPFDNHTIPPDEAGSWETWKAHTEFSNFNHHFSGWLVLVMGMAMTGAALWGGEKSKYTHLWPLMTLGVAMFILYRSDPEYWPFGPRTLTELLGDREAIEHKLSGIIVLAMGSVEWLRARRILSHWFWGMIFPWLAIMGGVTLLFHLHPISNFNYVGRANSPHTTEGVTAILAGMTYLLATLGIMKQRWWGLVPALFVILMGVQLIVYVE